MATKLKAIEGGGLARTSRFAAKQDAILKAAVSLFNQHGVKAVGITEIAASVGLVTNSVTYYYRKKDDLASACYLRAIDEHSRVFAEAAKAPSSTEAVQKCLRLYVEFMHAVHTGRRDPVIYFDDVRGLNEAAAGPVFSAYTDMFRSARALFSIGPGAAPSRLSLNARTHLFLSLILWMPAWLHRYEPEDYSSIAGRISAILTGGLAADQSPWLAEPARPSAEPVNREEVSREAFLRAATDLINEHGYHGASVDRISARLNVTKGSFYYHNDNKDDLVVDCFHRTFDQIRQAQNQAGGMDADGWTKLHSACTALIRHQLSPQGPLLRSTALHAVPEAIRHELALRMNRLSDRFANFIIEGIVDRSIRAIDPIVAGHLINPMINGAADLFRWAPGIDVETALEFYVKPLLLGFGPRAGMAAGVSPQP